MRREASGFNAITSHTSQLIKEIEQIAKSNVNVLDTKGQNWSKVRREVIEKATKGRTLHNQILAGNAPRLDPATQEELLNVPDLQKYRDAMNEQTRLVGEALRMLLIEIAHPDYQLRIRKNADGSPESASQLYEYLKTRCQSTSESNKKFLREKLNTVVHPQNQINPRKTLRAIYEIAAQLTDAGAELSQQELASHIRRAFTSPESIITTAAMANGQPLPPLLWTPVVEAAWSDDITGNDLRTKIETFAETRIKEVQTATAQLKALTNAKLLAKPEKRRPQSAHFASPNDDDQKDEDKACAFCGYTNHRLENCFRMKEHAKIYQEKREQARKEKAEKREKNRAKNKKKHATNSVQFAANLEKALGLEDDDGVEMDFP